MVYFADPSDIRNIRDHEIRYDDRGNARATLAFDYRGNEVVITEPRDLLLGDNEPSRKWIAQNYGFLLAMTGTEKQGEPETAAAA